MKVGTVQKDAGVFDEPRCGVAVFVSLDDPVFSLGFELPLVVGEALRRLEYPLDVLFVDEVSAVTAAALCHVGGVTIENTLAPVIENAGPVALQECHIKDVSAVLVFVFETDPLMGF